MTEPTSDWTPRLVALDIDGTLLKWVEGAGMTHEEIAPAVHAAVQRALDAGAHVVLASGRSPHGMTRVADLLDLHDAGPGPALDRRVERRGGVPLPAARGRPRGEVRRPARRSRRSSSGTPRALVAVEERGVGYRVNSHFPEGELSGDMIVTEVDDLIAAEVSRVIIRDPAATADDFVALAADLGLHGTSYVVGWTAWLDLAPVGVSKASGLEYVAQQLGLTAADALAVGDGRNDLEMFEWARRGVAMGQAIEEVLDAADDVTGSVYDDGLATELQRWFPMTPPRRDRQRAAPAAAVDAGGGRRHPGRPPPRRPGTATTRARTTGTQRRMFRADDPWAPRHIVRGETALGSIGFFGPPEPAADGVPEAEVGYGLVEEARGWGFATEALRAVLVETDRAGVRVRASVEPTNAASVRVLAKCGFTELRGSNEDGHLVMARPLPADVTADRLVATDLDGTLVRSDGTRVAVHRRRPRRRSRRSASRSCS